MWAAVRNPKCCCDSIVKSNEQVYQYRQDHIFASILEEHYILIFSVSHLRARRYAEL